MTRVVVSGLWRVSRAARRLGVRPSMILRLIRRRDLAAVKIGRQWRIEPEAIDTYIATRRQDARPVEVEAPLVDDRQIPLFDAALDAATAAGEAEARLALALDVEAPAGVEDSERLTPADLDNAVEDADAFLTRMGVRLPS